MVFVARLDRARPGTIFPETEMEEQGKRVDTGRSVEAQLLVSCVRARFDRTAGGRLEELCAMHPDWHRVLSLAERHAVIPHVHAALGTPRAHLLPQCTARELHASYWANAIRSLFLTRALLNLLKALAGNGIRVVPLKGPALAYQLYEAPEMRQMGDLDLLFDSADMTRVRRTLTDLGFIPDFALTRQQETLLMRSTHHRTYRHPLNGLRVEAHWAIAPPTLGVALPFGELWQRLEHLSVGKHSIPVMSPEDTLLSLCAHATVHTWSTLGMLSDVAALVRTHPVDPETLIARATTSRTLRMAHTGAALVADVLGASIVPKMLARDAAASVTARGLARQARSRLFDERPIRADHRSRTSFYIRSIDRRADRVRYVFREALLPTEDEFTSSPVSRRLPFTAGLLRPRHLITHLSR